MLKSQHIKLVMKVQFILMSNQNPEPIMQMMLAGKKQKTVHVGESGKESMVHD
jgi:hypothetical protein